MLFLALPLALDDFWVLFTTRVFILGLLALSFDLVWGYAGILSFGQALFFGVAGYSCALLATQAGITSILLLLPAAGLAGLVVSVALAFLILLGRRVPTTRLRCTRHPHGFLRRGTPGTRMVLRRRTKRHPLAAAAHRSRA